MYNGKTGAVIVRTLLNAVNVAGPSNGHTPHSVNRTFQVIITGTASVNIEASNDGVNWIVLSTFAASNGCVDTAPWAFVRANVTSISSGTVTVLLGV